MPETVIDFLKKTKNNYPEKIACIDDNSLCTYKELWDDSEKIALFLCSKGNIDKPVPIFMKKSCTALKVIMGIIRAGACYCMIDPMLPQKRIKSMLDTLKSTIIIVGTGVNINKIPQNISVINEREMYRNISEEKLESKVCGEKPIYVMFTSGSTGIPKGVMISHQAVADFINEFTAKFGIEENDIIGNQAPWDFDVSVKDIFSAIKTGATLRIIDKKYFSIPVSLLEMLEQSKVTTLTWAVSALCILSSSGMMEKIKLSHLKRVIFSGEVMPVKQLNIWRRLYPDVMFVNVYGPTEVTCNCTYHIIDQNMTYKHVIPIGKSFDGDTVFLLDEKNKIIKANTTNLAGEVCVSGSRLALGYYNNPKETESKFVKNPIDNTKKGLIYRTGDLAYYDGHGDLCYVGRKDFQIKYMGHRIELMEIEQSLEQYTGIVNARCIYKNKKIYAFYTGTAEEKEVRKFLRTQLPMYMIPDSFIKKQVMPYNLHGKIDRRRLEEEIEETV